MRIVAPAFEILYPGNNQEWIREFKLIELAGRTAYKSEDKITDDSYIKFIEGMRRRNHGAVLEFGSMMVHFVTDRGISHELVRHRLCSFLQESTRYVNYGSGKFGAEITVICPTMDQTSPAFNTWYRACQDSEESYMTMIAENKPAQIARSVLPTCTKTEIVVKTNFREWGHIFNLRAKGSTGKPHPDMVKLIGPLYDQLARAYPFMFAPLVDMDNVFDNL
jgi:thymidylate synthase (FAD)